MITYEDAVDEMFSMFKTTWDSSTTALIGYVPEIRWQGVEETTAPDTSKYFARVSQQTISDDQASLRNGVDGQRYRTDGLLLIQIFCPRSDATAIINGRKLAIIARDIYRGHSTSGSVWFRRARINEIPPEDKFLQFNVISEYQYDEIQ